MPIHAFVEGDTLGLLVLATAHQSVEALARQILQAAAPRVAPFAPAHVRWNGRTLDAAKTLEQCGLSALTRVDVVRERGQP